MNAPKEASLSYLDAAIKEQVDNAATAKNIYKREWDYYEGLVSTVTISNAVSVYNTALTHKNTVNVKSEIAIAELANKAVRVASDIVTAAKYKIAENVAWVTYYVTTIATEVTYLAAYVSAESTFGTAKKDADEAFDLAVIPAWVNYSMDLRAWEACFIAAVAHCADPNFVAANWFNNNPNTVAGDFTFVTLKTTGEGRQPGQMPGYGDQQPMMGPIQPVAPREQPIMVPMNPYGDFLRADGSIGHVNQNTDRHVVNSLLNGNPYTTGNSNLALKVEEKYNRPLNSVVDLEAKREAYDFTPPPELAGGLQVIGGLGEMFVGGAAIVGGGGGTATGVGAPPGIATFIFGTMAWLHGLDNVVTGAQTAWTGEFQYTSTSNIITEATGSRVYGEIGDITIGFVAPGGAAWFSTPAKVTSAAGELGELQQMQAKLASQIEAMSRLGIDPHQGFNKYEMATALRLEKILGKQLTRDPSGAAEWIDAAGKTYDAMGGNLPKYNLDQFLKSIISHTRKSNDYTVIDIVNWPAKDQAAIIDFINNLPSATQKTIIIIK